MKQLNHPWRRAQKTAQVVKKACAQNQLDSLNKLLAQKGRLPAKTTRRLRGMESSRKD